MLMFVLQLDWLEIVYDFNSNVYALSFVVCSNFDKILVFFDKRNLFFIFWNISDHQKNKAESNDKK